LVASLERGIAIEMVRLYQVELEHYEKIRGAPQLTLEGKATGSRTMIRGNLGKAMQGLPSSHVCRFETDSRRPVHAERSSVSTPRGPIRAVIRRVGSGSVFARAREESLWRPGPRPPRVVRVLIEALYDAAAEELGQAAPT